MTEICFDIDALDTLMFRDGRPFNQMDAGASEATSVFPPHPPTLVDALRAMLWQNLGGTKDDWDNAKLGNGTNWQDPGTLGPLRFGAPQLMLNGAPVFPSPLHLVEAEDQEGKKELTFLEPTGPYTCDLGKVMLPSAGNADLNGIKTLSDHWLTLEGMDAVLSGVVPEAKQQIRQTDLWRMESRVGIGINPKTHITTDGQLYMASHVRMADKATLRVTLDGWCGPAGFAQLRPVAGEHRVAFVSSKSKHAAPQQFAPTGGDRFCIIALSPVVPTDLDNGRSTILGLPEGDIVSACIGKVVPIGGWNSQDRKPVPFKSCLPAGSVWFLEAGAVIPETIGEASAWGFGQIMIAKW